MKVRHSIVGLVLLVMGNLTLAQHVTVNTARKFALNHLSGTVMNQGNEQLKSAVAAGKGLMLTSAGISEQSGDTLYYVFRITREKGFIIVSGDKRIYPLIGYSLEDVYSGDQPPAFTQMIESRKNEIEGAISGNLTPDAKISAAWNNLGKLLTDTITKGPLLKTTWDQLYPYNGMCPPDTAILKGGRCPAGCAVSSMTQIMKYWNYPEYGEDSLCYLDPRYGKQCAAFVKTRYQWAEMPEVARSKNPYIEKLFYHTAVSLQTEFGPVTSYAHMNPRNPLVRYFKYDRAADSIQYKKVGSQRWAEIIRAEIDSFRPVWISGSGVGNHAFVCDGYQNPGYFHINWGWSGRFDGWFPMEKLNPKDSTFFWANTLEAVIKIYPKTVPDAVMEFVEGDTLVCPGTSATYSIGEVPGASNYIWSLPNGVTGKSTTTTIDLQFGWNFKSGLLKVKGNNPQGDGKEKSLFIRGRVVPPHPGPLTCKKTYKPGDTITYSVPRTDGYSYIWKWPSTGWKEVSGSNTNTVSVVPDSIKGQVQIFLSNGECLGLPSICYPTEIAEQSLDTGFSVYPNPVHDILYIRENGMHMTYRLRIYDMMGRLIYQSGEDNESSVNTRHFPNGIYLLKIETDQRSVVRKFIK